MLRLSNSDIHWWLHDIYFGTDPMVKNIGHPGKKTLGNLQMQEPRIESGLQQDLSTPACRKGRVIWNGSSDEISKTEAPYHSRHTCSTTKCSPCSKKAVDTQHRSQFCSPSPTKVTYLYERNSLETNKQTNKLVLPDFGHS